MQSTDCVICSVTSLYRCPQCACRYCSAACYKTHKLSCYLLQPSQPTASNASLQLTETVTVTEPTQYGAIDFESIRNDTKIRELLKFSSVRAHLNLVARIAIDPAISGETTSEGRRYVAIKKLRELRQGGREQNEAIELVARRITELIAPASSSI